MRRVLASAAITLALAACTGPQAQAARTATPQTVVQQPGDVPGMERCATSGNVKTVLAQEKVERSLAYDMHATEWAQWKQQGATDAYFAVYGRTAADCAAVSASGTGAPRGALMVGLVVEFRDSNLAAVNYHRDSTLMGLGPQDMRFIELANGTTTFGTDTGLGPQSMTGSGLVAGTNYFVAMWQNKKFESDFIGYAVADSDADRAVLDMNRRIL